MKPWQAAQQNLCASTFTCNSKTKTAIVATKIKPHKNRESLLLQTFWSTATEKPSATTQKRLQISTKTNQISNPNKLFTSETLATRRIEPLTEKGKTARNKRPAKKLFQGFFKAFSRLFRLKGKKLPSFKYFINALPHTLRSSHII